MATGEHLSKPSTEQRAAAAKEHLERSIKWKGETLGVLEMRRHYSNYFKGIPHFKETRMQLVTEMDPTALTEILGSIRTTYDEVTL